MAPQTVLRALSSGALWYTGVVNAWTLEQTNPEPSPRHPKLCTPFSLQLLRLAQVALLLLLLFLGVAVFTFAKPEEEERLSALFSWRRRL